MSTAAAKLCTDTKSKTWDRAPGESAKAFNAFSCFRDMGPERSCSKVAQRLQKSGTLMRRWSLQFNWVARALAFDEFCDRNARRELSQKCLEFKKASLVIAETLKEKAEAGIAALRATKTVNRADGREEVKLAISTRDLLKMIELSQKIHQSVLGDAESDQTPEIHVHYGAYEDGPEGESEHSSECGFKNADG
jgi:hypothetical protein